MFVGTAKLTLSIPGAASLKDKRQVLRKLIDRTRARFNAAVAEVGDNDLWQRAVVGVAVVGNERRFTEEQLDTVIRFIEESDLAPVLDRHTEVNAVGSFNNQSLSPGDLRIPTGDERTLAEAEAEDAEHFDGEDDFFKA
jgi:hypothetical protein